MTGGRTGLVCEDGLRNVRRLPGGRPHASHRCGISAIAKPRPHQALLFPSPHWWPQAQRARDRSFPKQGGPSSALAHTSEFQGPLVPVVGDEQVPAAPLLPMSRPQAKHSRAP